MSPAKWWPFCLGVNVLISTDTSRDRLVTILKTTRATENLPATVTTGGYNDNVSPELNMITKCIFSDDRQKESLWISFQISLKSVA